jgi:RHS repeat-associated protein
VVSEESSAGQWNRGEVYAGGQHLVTYNHKVTYFIAADALGTERMRSTLDGTSYESCMNLPFGDGLTCTGPTAGEVSPLHFTGKERDAEDTVSGNDYFGARYYASNMGRFLSPDPSQLYYADPMNPQSLNLYSYGQNNPLINIDPTGLDCIHVNVDTGQYEGFERGDCDNSTEEKANSGQYVEGTVNTIYTTTGDTSGVVTGYSGKNNDTGALILARVAMPLPDPDEQRIDAFAQAVVTDMAGFPDVCSGGGFLYAGYQRPLGQGEGEDRAHGFIGYLGNYDSKDGWSNNVLLEGSKGNGSGGVAGGSNGVDGLVFIPFAEAGGGLVSVSKGGLAVGAYVGTPEKFPVGAGAGAYFNISTMGGCARHP